MSIFVKTLKGKEQQLSFKGPYECASSAVQGLQLQTQSEIDIVKTLCGVNSLKVVLKLDERNCLCYQITQMEYWTNADL